jgi:hypothetical protein
MNIPTNFIKYYAPDTIMTWGVIQPPSYLKIKDERYAIAYYASNPEREGPAIAIATGENTIILNGLHRSYVAVYKGEKMPIAVIRSQIHLKFLAEVNRTQSNLLNEYPLFKNENLCIDVNGTYNKAIGDAESQFNGLTFFEWATGLETILKNMGLDSELEEEEEYGEDDQYEDNFYWPE